MPAVIVRGPPIKPLSTPSTDTATQPATVAVAAVSTEVLAAGTYSYLLIQNIGSHDVYLDLTGGTPTTSSGFLLAKAGGSLELTHWVPTAAINGIADGGVSNVEVLYVGS